jgi:hypothetical protein
MEAGAALDLALRRGSRPLAPASESRFQRIRMGVAELFEVLKTGTILTLSSSIPRTARVRHVSYTEENHCFELLIEDASFSPVAEMTRVPMIEGPAFAVFPLDDEAMREFVASHAPHLGEYLAPEYAESRDLARVPETPDWLEERD